MQQNNLGVEPFPERRAPAWLAQLASTLPELPVAKDSPPPSPPLPPATADKRANSSPRPPPPAKRQRDA